MNHSTRHSRETRLLARRGGILLLPVVFAGALAGCESPETAALRDRAEAFGDLLMQISDLHRSKAKRELERFIEPSSARSKRIATYYADFSAKSEKFTITSQSVERIRIAPDGVTAEVTYRIVALTPGGKPVEALQKTGWRRVDGTWYRVVGDPEKTLVSHG